MLLVLHLLVVFLRPRSPNAPPVCAVQVTNTQPHKNVQSANWKIIIKPVFMVQTSIYERHLSYLYNQPASHWRAAMGLEKLSFPSQWSMMALDVVDVWLVEGKNFSNTNTHGSLVSAAYSFMFPTLNNHHFRNKMNRGEHSYHQEKLWQLNIINKHSYYRAYACCVSKLD